MLSHQRMTLISTKQRVPMALSVWPLAHSIGVISCSDSMMNPTSDALITTARVLQLLSQSDHPLSRLWAEQIPPAG
jgi:hypothetical protein